MTDKHVSSDGKELKPTMTIFLTESGEMKVSGPINDQMICLGILEQAKQVIINHNNTRSKSNIVIPKTQDNGAKHG